MIGCEEKMSARLGRPVTMRGPKFYVEVSCMDDVGSDDVWPEGRVGRRRDGAPETLAYKRSVWKVMRVHTGAASLLWLAFLMVTERDPKLRRPWQG